VGLHPRHRIDIAPTALVEALGRCVVAPRHAAESLEAATGPGAAEVIATLSVRSGFDLLLDCLQLAPGDEVLLSAWTIPDMVRIVRDHGLVPVPLDCDAESLAPTREGLLRALSPRSRLVVVAQLFGASVDLTDLAAAAHAHGLLVVDDDAQGYTGPARLAGSPVADVVFHSFGTIKTATALGGGLVRVRDPALRARMRSRMAGWAVQPTARYARKLLTWIGLVVPRDPDRYAVLAEAVRDRGHDFDALMMAVSRGFPADTPGALRRSIRQRPCAALCATLQRRIEEDHTPRIALRCAAGERLRARLGTGVTMLGSSMAARTHWLCAVTVDDPDGLVAALRAAGFDAARATSSLATVPTAPERPEVVAAACAAWAGRVVFVPTYPEISEVDRDRMAAVIAGLPSAVAARD